MKSTRKLTTEERLELLEALAHLAEMNRNLSYDYDIQAQNEHRFEMSINLEVKSERHNESFNVDAELIKAVSEGRICIIEDNDNDDSKEGTV